MARIAARYAAVQLVFEQMFDGIGGDTTLHDLIGFEPEADDGAYIAKLVEGVTAHTEELDEIISKYLRGWTIDRISKVAVAVLRTAIWEILYTKDVSPSIIINEAVDFAKRYDSPQAGKFINGLLASVVNEEAAR